MAMKAFEDERTRRGCFQAVIATALLPVFLVLLVIGLNHAFKRWVWNRHQEFLCEVCGLADLSCDTVHRNFEAIYSCRFGPISVTDGPAKETVLETLGRPNWTIEPDSDAQQADVSLSNPGPWPREYLMIGRPVQSGQVLVYGRGMVQAMIWMSRDGRVERIWVGST